MQYRSSIHDVYIYCSMLHASVLFYEIANLAFIAILQAMPRKNCETLRDAVEGERPKK